MNTLNKHDCVFRNNTWNCGIFCNNNIFCNSNSRVNFLVGSVRFKCFMEYGNSIINTSAKQFQNLFVYKLWTIIISFLSFQNYCFLLRIFETDWLENKIKCRVSKHGKNLVKNKNVTQTSQIVIFCWREKSLSKRNESPLKK